MKKYDFLVLGGFGFIGSSVCKELKNNNKSYIAHSRRTGIDLTDSADLIKLLKKNKFKYIINCAGHVGSIKYINTIPTQIYNDNVLMSLNLYKAVEQSRSTSEIINLYSNCFYPASENIQKEKNILSGPTHHSVKAFAEAKRFLLTLSTLYEKQYKIRSKNLIVPNAYGPGDYTDPERTHALNGMIIRMTKNKNEDKKEFTIWGTGNPVREWIYVEDIAKLIIKSSQLKICEPINLAQHKGYKIKHSAKLIAKCLNYKVKLFFDTKYQDGDPKKILDNTLFKKVFKNFKFTDHKTGIYNTIKYYEQKFKI